MLCVTGAFGCAQSVHGPGGSTTTGTGGTTGGASTGGATGGSTGGTGGVVPEMCTTADECQALANACNTAACEGGKCDAKPANDFQLCDDKNPCTLNDQCSGGTCSGNTKSCGSAPLCQIAKCNPATGACEDAVTALPVGGPDQLARFADAGVDVDAVAGELQRKGAESFVGSWTSLLDRIASKVAAVA